MIGPEAGAWIAQLVFAFLIIWGGVSREMSVTSAATFVCIWILAFVARPYVPYGAPLFSPFVALLDVVLVLLIFKRDISLT